MKRQRIRDRKGVELLSSNGYEDDDCPVCQLMRQCEAEDRDPEMRELEVAMKQSTS